MAPEIWMARLLDEFDRFVDEMAKWDLKRHCWAIGNACVAREDLRQIRHEVIDLATTSAAELAYRVMPLGDASEREAALCRMCDAAVRLGWGKSPTRRRLQLPVSADFQRFTEPLAAALHGG